MEKERGGRVHSPWQGWCFGSDVERRSVSRLGTTTTTRMIRGGCGGKGGLVEVQSVKELRVEQQDGRWR